MSKSNSSGGNWVTINGAHILIGADGTVNKGPSSLVGKRMGGAKDGSLINVQDTISLMSAKADLRNQLKKNKEEAKQIERKKRLEEAKEGHSRSFEAYCKRFGVDPQSPNAQIEVYGRLLKQQTAERDAKLEAKKQRIDQEVAKGYRVYQGLPVPLKYFRGNSATSVTQEPRLTPEGVKAVNATIRSNPKTWTVVPPNALARAMAPVLEKAGVSPRYQDFAIGVLKSGGTLETAVATAKKYQKK